MPSKSAGKSRVVERIARETHRFGSRRDGCQGTEPRAVGSAWPRSDVVADEATEPRSSVGVPGSRQRRSPLGSRADTAAFHLMHFVNQIREDLRMIGNPCQPRPTAMSFHAKPHEHPFGTTARLSKSGQRGADLRIDLEMDSTRCRHMPFAVESIRIEKPWAHPVSRPKQMARQLVGWPSDGLDDLVAEPIEAALH